MAIIQHQGDFITVLIEKSHYTHQDVANELGITADELHTILADPYANTKQLKAVYLSLKPTTTVVQRSLHELLVRIEVFAKMGDFEALLGTLSIFKKYQKAFNKLSAQISIADPELDAPATKKLQALLQKIKKAVQRINSQYDVFALLGWLGKADYAFLRISHFFYPIAIPPRVLMGLFLGLFFFVVLSFSLIITNTTHEKKSDQQELSDNQPAYKCHETICLSCGKCFEVACFEVALSCYNNQGVLSTQDQLRQTECIKILRADSCFAAGDFRKAAELYNELEDAIVIRYAKRKKALAELLITAQDQSIEEATAQIKQVDEALNNTAEELPQQAKESLKKLKKELEVTLKSQWEGSWNQEQSGKNGVIKGMVTIKFDPDFSHGSFTDEFAHNVRQHGELRNLEFNQDATEISGTWYNKSTQLEGRFFLKFNASRDYFKGYYTMPNSTKEYYWNGYK
ncbi:MAG: hypothetical protein ACPGJS_09385 [Flammeovirgaceae bacterium]